MISRPVYITIPSPSQEFPPPSGGRGGPCPPSQDTPPPSGGRGVPDRVCCLPLRTREDPRYLIPAGTYDVRMTYSPKFGKLMPEILNVPRLDEHGRKVGMRTGIRLHLGTHSEGCLLLTEPEYTHLRSLLTTYGTLTIHISDVPPRSV